MVKIVSVILMLLVLVLVLLFSFAPDVLTIAFLAMMALCVLLGTAFGIVPAMQFSSALQKATEKIRRIGQVQSGSAWISVQQTDNLFQQKALDALFENFMAKAKKQERDGQVISNVEETINEDSLSLRCWGGVVRQIPGTLTALGLLGTFLGLIIGISTIGFSSVEAALSSIESLIGGIRTAFYTSIAGVILSILFDLVFRMMWNGMLRELGMFTEAFHSVVFPNVEEQFRSRQISSLGAILEQLEQLPKEQEFSGASRLSGMISSDLTSEQRMMPDIRQGLLDGNFIFLIQPRYDLNSRKITGGEALVRWEHGELGMIYPAAFMQVVERNGFVVKIDQFIWEEVCKTLRRWMDTGVRPVPISVNISKIDILALDVAQIFTGLIQKYGIAPRYLELEIAESAYLEAGDAAYEVEQQLRRCGFRVIIDGFDEEFLAMSVMKKTEADALKLDMRYMGTMSDKRESAVDTMIEQARKLRIPVLAKCIESAEQLSDLRRCGCTEGQGNYLKKAVSVEEFERITE